MAPHLPPALMDDIIVDILLRLRPDDTACLTRASLVCKAWHRVLSDRAFHRRYREIHGAAPFLGFLYNNYYAGGSSPFFVPTTPASPFSPEAAAGSPTCCRTLDCRHGRVLLHHPGYTSCLTVWDPVTGLQRCIYAPLVPLTAAVLCASNGCDHLDCGDGPYLVFLVAKTSYDYDYEHLGVGVAQAQAPASVYLYSSETGKWRESPSIDVSRLPMAPRPSLLAGDALFFLLGSGRVLKCDLTRGALSVIWVPLYPKQMMILCTPQDGELGVAAVEGGRRLRLLSGRTDPDGVMRWVQDRAIELDSMIPVGVGGASPKFCVVGFAEGTGYIFVQANDSSIFSVDVKSGRISKIGSGKFGPIFPFLRFYIPDLCASASLHVPMRIQ